MSPLKRMRELTKGRGYAMWLAFQFEHYRPNKPVPEYSGTTTLDKNGRRVWTGKLKRASDRSFHAPLRWRKPQRIFTNSMSDLFHIKVPDGTRREVFDIIDQCPRHTFQMLTKRPENYAWMLKAIGRDRVPDNLWLGCTIEGGPDIIDPHTRRPVTDRLDMMREVDARVRWISFEPLIGPVGKVDLSGIHWAVIGGESGKHARRVDPAWVDDLIWQCRKQGVAVFFKQWGRREFNPDPSDPTIKDSAGGCQVHGQISREFPSSPTPMAAGTSAQITPISGPSTAYDSESKIDAALSAGRITKRQAAAYRAWITMRAHRGAGRSQS